MEWETGVAAAVISSTLARRRGTAAVSRDSAAQRQTIALTKWQPAMTKPWRQGFVAVGPGAVADARAPLIAVQLTGGVIRLVILHTAITAPRQQQARPYGRMVLIKRRHILTVIRTVETEPWEMGTV